MANLVIRNTVTGDSGYPTLYDQQANQVVQVWFEQGGVDAFVADPANPAAGEYELVTWSEIYGPDGPAVILLGGDGTIASPKEFTPNLPGRWLVRLTAEKYILDDDLNVVLSGQPETFTALYEIQDPNIIGHRAAKPYGNGAVTRGTSTIAPTESTEFDSDEGWSRGIERYLTTVSREQGFRSTIVVYNDSGVQIDAGKVVVVDDADFLSVWKNTDSSLEDFQNTIVKIKLATSAQDGLRGIPKFLAVEDIPSGERGVAIVEGLIPYDTTLLADGDVLYVSDLGELTKSKPSDADPLHTDARVGLVSMGGKLDTDASPGSVYFHGHTGLLPGFIEGPLSSTDNAIATWNGSDGDKLNSSDISVYTSPGVGPIRIKALEDRTFQIQSASNAWNKLDIASGESHAFEGSGDTVLRTGQSAGFATGRLQLYSGDTNADTAGEVELRAGRSQLVGANVRITGGESVTDQGGDVEITGGSAQALGQTPGDVVIHGGENTADSTYGTVVIGNASQVSFTAPLVRTYAETTQWVATDPAGVGGDKPKAQIFHTYGTNTQFYLMDEAGVLSLELNSDSHSYFLNKLSIGTTAAPDAVDHLRIDGNATVNGDFTIDGKLNVSGLIDPTGLILTATGEGDVPVAAGEGAVFVSDGSDGLTAGDLYYKDSGGANTSLTAVAGGGGVLTGPLAAGSTTPNQVATWSNANGDDIQGSGITVTGTAEISSLKNGANEAHDISIQPGESTTGADRRGANVSVTAGTPELAGPGGSLTFEAGSSTGDVPGGVSVLAGSTTDTLSNGGDVDIRAGAGNLPAIGATDGGGVTLYGGKGGRHGGPVTILGGDSEDDTGLAGTDNGGSVTIEGGSGGRLGQKGGPVDLIGGIGGSGKPGVFRGGMGGEISLFAGSAGPVSGHKGGDVTIRGGVGDALDPAIGLGNHVGPSGRVEIVGGEGPPTAGGFIHSEGGGALELRGGDANPASTGNGGSVLVEPGKGGAAPGKPGALLLCNEDDGFGLQKSFTSIGSPIVSGLAGPIGWCGPKPAHTVHGDLKVTGVVDPVAFFLEPQAENPVKLQFQAANDAGDLDENGDPIDINDPAIQRKINNAMWVDENNDDRIMVGSEPIGTEGTIKYDSETVVYDPDEAIDLAGGGIVEGDLSPEVFYYDVPAVMGIVLVDSDAGDVAIMLPDATLYPKRSIFVKDKKGKSNVPGHGQILVIPPSTQTLDGYSYPGEAGDGPYPVQPWASVQCYSDGENWFII